MLSFSFVSGWPPVPCGELPLHLHALCIVLSMTAFWALLAFLQRIEDKRSEEQISREVCPRPGGGHVSHCNTGAEEEDCHDSEDEASQESDRESCFSFCTAPTRRPPVQKAKKHGTQDLDAGVEELRARFPRAATAELRRFCRARPKSTQEAAQMYQKHLAWRREQGSKDNLLKASLAIPPKYIRQAGRARDGTPILLVQGAMYDSSVAPEMYMLACGHALDQMFAAESEEKFTLLIDARPGDGWPNAPAPTMMPFFRLACSVLPDNYPERVQKVVIYPMPSILGQLWSMVSCLLDPKTRAKFQVLSGPDAIGAPCPRELGDVVALEELPLDVQKNHLSLSAN